MAKNNEIANLRARIEELEAQSEVEEQPTYQQADVPGVRVAAGGGGLLLKAAVSAIVRKGKAPPVDAMSK